MRLSKHSELFFSNLLVVRFKSNRNQELETCNYSALSDGSRLGCPTISVKIGSSVEVKKANRVAGQHFVAFLVLDPNERIVDDLL